MKPEILLHSIFLLCLAMRCKAALHDDSDYNTLVNVESPLNALRTELRNLSQRLDAVNYRITIDSWFTTLFTAELQCRMDNLTTELGLDDDIKGLRERLHKSKLMDATNPAIQNLVERLGALEANELHSTLDQHVKRLNDRIDDQSRLLAACQQPVWPDEVEPALTEFDERLDELELAVNASASDAEKSLHDVTELFNALLSQQDELATQTELNVLTQQLAELSATMDALPTVPVVLNDGNNSMPTNCRQAMAANDTSSGVYKILVAAYKSTPFEVYCEARFGGGWLVVQRRLNPKVTFNRNWWKYKHGFGYLNNSYFIGLDKLHALTATNQKQELLIVLTDFQNVTKTARYTEFAVGDHRSAYALKTLGKFVGTKGLPDALRSHVSMKFSTFDSKNGSHRCAKRYEGGWWFKNCATSYLNGKLIPPHQGNGIIWCGFHGGDETENLKYVQMMIRPQQS